LAERTTSARMALSTSIDPPGLIPILVGGCEAAWAEIGIWVDLLMRPESSASNSM